VAACIAALVFLVVLMFLRDRPEDMGLKSYGWQRTQDSGPTGKASLQPVADLRLALRSPALWVHGGSFAMCGASTNG
jgi:sugar phosphate permease